MVECRYADGISSFALEVVKEQWSEVDVMARGGDALRDASAELGSVSTLSVAHTVQQPECRDNFVTHHCLHAPISVSSFF